MVCVYCGGKTKVTNSRLNRRNNVVWRRRSCLKCGSVITTEETARYGSALAVRRPDGALQPFSRDKLLVSLYRSLAHRRTAPDDAARLCDTIIGQLRGRQADSGVCELTTVKQAAGSCLERFDSLAGNHYSAYHP